MNKQKNECKNVCNIFFVQLCSYAIMQLCSCAVVQAYKNKRMNTILCEYDNKRI